MTSLLLKLVRVDTLLFLSPGLTWRVCRAERVRLSGGAYHLAGVCAGALERACLPLSGRA